jgi:hypothetical protein
MMTPPAIAMISRTIPMMSHSTRCSFQVGSDGHGSP